MARLAGACWNAFKIHVNINIGCAQGVSKQGRGEREQASKQVSKPVSKPGREGMQEGVREQAFEQAS